MESEINVNEDENVNKEQFGKKEAPKIGQSEKRKNWHDEWERKCFSFVTINCNGFLVI